MGAHADPGCLGGETLRGPRVQNLSSKGRPIDKLNEDAAGAGAVPPAREPWRAWSGRALSVALGALPLIWISRRIVLGDVLAELGRVGLAHLGLAWFLLFGGTLVGSYRWR